MMRYPNVLLLSGDGTETATLEKLLSPHVVLTVVSGLLDLASRLELGRYDALLCAWSFQMGTWTEALEEAHRRQPDLPVLVLHNTADEREWMHTLDAGAFDLLAPPYREQSLLAALEQASSSRMRGSRDRVARTAKAYGLPTEREGS